MRVERRFIAPISLAHTGVTNAGAVVWAMRVAPASNTDWALVEQIYLLAKFSGASSLGVGSFFRYAMGGFGGSAPTGGTVIDSATMDSSNPASVVTDIRQSATGLTTTGMSLGPAGLVHGVTETRGDSSSLIFREEFRLSPGQGFYIRLATAAANGLSLSGYVQWKERK